MNSFFQNKKTIYKPQGTIVTWKSDIDLLASRHAAAHFLISCKALIAFLSIEVLAITFLLFSFCSLAAMPLNSQAQLLISVTIILLLFLLSKFFPKKGVARLLFMSMAVFLVLRYLYWRLSFTLPSSDPFSIFCSWILLAAELYGIFMLFLNIFVNIRPIEREPAMPLANHECPTVDVYIPSYDENQELLTATLLGALSIRYPKDKLNIYLLDDGGTTAKRNQTDQHEAKKAKKRYCALKQLCQTLDVHYLARQKNEHAKAGNLNFAFEQTSGELILVLDADHVPTMDLLEKTVGYFKDDHKLFLVQTPHFFITPDSIEKNLNICNSMPSENFMFYGAIHPGMDFWNASFFCGSAALLRRKALEESNGFSGESITEDAETALCLHAKGWNSRYLNHPFISGLQPETFSSFVIQRMRWAQGMVQIFLLKNPLTMKGLSFAQKLNYLSSTLFWFFPIARIIFAIAPAAYLVFGLHIYNATLFDLTIYTVPYLTVIIMVSSYMFSKVRWNFISNIYELMQAMYSFGAIVEVLKNPRKPVFKVTPKNERLNHDFISPLAKPFYWMIAGTTAIFFIGLHRFFYHQEEQALTGAALFWVLFNFIILSASLGALLERRQRRANPRLSGGFETTLLQGNNTCNLVSVCDISMGGALLIAPKRLGQKLTKRRDLYITGVSTSNNTPYKIPLMVCEEKQQNDFFFYRVQFCKTSLTSQKHLVQLIHGQSDRWKKTLDNATPDPGFMKGMYFLTRTAVLHIIKYLTIYLTTLWLRYLPQLFKLCIGKTAKKEFYRLGHPLAREKEDGGRLF